MKETIYFQVALNIVKREKILRAFQTNNKISAKQVSLMIYNVNMINDMMLIVQGNLY